MYPIPDLASLRTVEELSTAITGMKDRITEIHGEFGVRPLDDDHRAEWDALQESIEDFEGALTEADGRRKVVEAWAAQPKNREEHKTYGGVQIARSRLPDNLYDLPEYRNRTNGAPAAHAALLRDGAKKIADDIRFPHPKTDRTKAVDNIHRLLDKSGDDSEFANHFIATSDPSYLRAVAKRFASPDVDILTPTERAAVGTVGTTTAGGFAVPDILDPVVILTSDGAVNPIRQMARVETISGAGNTWHSVTSTGIVLNYGPAEGSAITETTSPVLARPEVVVQPVKGELRYSVESAGDWPRLLSELSTMIQDARDVLEADQFINGVGTTVFPEGVVAGLAATSLVGTEGNGFGSDDIYRFINRLPVRFRSRAQFLANQLVYDTIAQFLVGDTSDQRMFIRGTGGNPGQLLSWTAREASEMEGDTDTAGNQVLLFGDFRTGYLIVDKVGLSIQDAGFVRDGNGALTGQRALFVHYRNSAVIQADNALRLLQIGVVTTGI